MFNSKEHKKEADIISNSSNIISEGTVLKGDIETFGNIRVEGEVIGNVRTKSKVAIGHSARVQGNVLAQNAEIEGELIGDIEVTDILILKPSAVVHGNIRTNKLIVEAGATFDGGCKMGMSTKEIKIEEFNKNGAESAPIQQQREEAEAL